MKHPRSTPRTVAWDAAKKIAMSATVLPVPNLISAVMTDMLAKPLIADRKQAETPPRKMAERSTSISPKKPKTSPEQQKQLETPHTFLTCAKWSKIKSLSGLSAPAT
jgi:hypothetical protein